MRALSMLPSGFKREVRKRIFDGAVAPVRLERIELPVLQIADHGWRVIESDDQATVLHADRDRPIPGVVVNTGIFLERQGSLESAARAASARFMVSAASSTSLSLTDLNAATQSSVAGRSNDPAHDKGWNRRRRPPPHWSEPRRRDFLAAPTSRGKRSPRPAGMADEFAPAIVAHSPAQGIVRKVRFKVARAGEGSPIGKIVCGAHISFDCRSLNRLSLAVNKFAVVQLQLHPLRHIGCAGV